MSGNMGGFQRAAPLPKTKHGQHSIEITAVIDYFRDGEIRNFNVSAQVGV